MGRAAGRAASSVPPPPRRRRGVFHNIIRNVSYGETLGRRIMTTAGRYAKSRELHERALGVLAGGVSSEFRKSSAPHPLFYREGAGARIWDVDGNEYLDFTLSQGPLILGHRHPEVEEAVAAASRRGQAFAGQHLTELELAEKLQKIIPCAERMRFSLSGSEADHAALRLARAVTGREKFI